MKKDEKLSVFNSVSYDGYFLEKKSAQNTILSRLSKKTPFLKTLNQIILPVNNITQRVLSIAIIVGFMTSILKKIQDQKDQKNRFFRKHGRSECNSTSFGG